MIGHSLAFAPRPATQVAWDRAISIGFSLGSLCFLIGPFPGFVHIVGEEADAAIFFIGSIFFTFAATLEVREATVRRGERWGRDPSWWSASVQWIGTLLFNLSTYDAWHDTLSVQGENRLIWTPDLIGSIAFLISGVLAYRVASAAKRHDREWRLAAVNLAGCILFMISAIGAYIVPSTGSDLDLALANLGTALGALCFLIGAVAVYPRRTARTRSPGARAGGS